eukprot:m.30737 g.30737  ORF g.30737 m.30737 type:complete len:171 (-) comp16338_c1_seq1:338-850(-)
MAIRLLRGTGLLRRCQLQLQTPLLKPHNHRSQIVAPTILIRFYSADSDKKTLLPFVDYTERMNTIIEHALVENDGEEIRRAKQLTTEFLDQYQQALASCSSDRKDSHIQSAWENVRRLQDGLKKLFLVERGRLEIGVLESGAGARSNILPQYRKDFKPSTKQDGNDDDLI